MAYKKGTHFFTIPMSPEEWAEIQRRAKAQGRSAANYGRMVLLDGKLNKKPKTTTMMCYKDRWWCPFHETCTHSGKCDRPLTDQVRSDATAHGLLIQEVVDKPGCHSDFIVKDLCLRVLGTSLAKK